MKDITLFEDSQEGRNSFGRLRRSALRNLTKISRDNDLNLTMGEVRFLTAFLTRTTFKLPWSWVQTGTQDEWAKDWGMSVNSLKKWLRSLREKEILLVTVAGVERDVLRGKRWQEHEFPVWTLNPVFMELVADQHHHELWKARMESGGELEAYATAFRMAFEGQSEPMFKATVKCLNSTYSSDFTRVPTLRQKPESLGNTGDTQGDTCVLDIDTIIIDTDTSEEGSDRVRRRHRRHRRSRVDRMRRMSHMDDEPPALGADPEAPAPSENAKRVSPTTEISLHFADEWNKTRWRADVTTKLPVMPWADGSKVAFMSWVKKSFLPDHDGDVELCKAMITAFCEQPAATHAASKRAPWRKFAGMQTKMRQKAYKNGYRTEAEKAKEDEDRQRMQEKNARVLSNMTAAREPERPAPIRSMTTKEKFLMDDQTPEEQ